MGDLPPEYDGCPLPCGDTNENLSRLCDSCPKRELREAFEETATEFLNSRCGDSWKRYGFESLAASVLDVLAIERIDRPDILTVRTSSLLQIVEGERRRMERIDEWNNRQKQRGRTE